MTAAIGAVIAGVGSLLLIGIGYLIKGAIAYFGKKGAEHVYTKYKERDE